MLNWTNQNRTKQEVFDTLPPASDSSEFQQKEVNSGPVQQQLAHKEVCWCHCPKGDQLTPNLYYW